MQRTVTLEEAQEMLRKQVTVKDTVMVPILDCADRILAEDIFAKINQPPFRRSSMDGYAVRSEEIRGASREHPVRLQIVDQVYAGTNEEKTIEKKQAVRIMTGGMLPEGADCVVKQEDTDYGEEIVSVYTEMQPGEYYCPVGHEFAKGMRIAEAGSNVDANVIAAAVAAGLKELPVRERIKAAVITTGDELCSLGGDRKIGQIYPSNLAYLHTRLKQLGCDVVMACQPQDCPENITEAIKTGLEKADVIITTGGVSVGVKDFLPTAVEGAGAKILFHGMAVNPGRPSMVSLYENKPVISLTGSPCSAEIVFELLIHSVLAAMLCTDTMELRSVSAVAQSEFPISKKYSRRFIRGCFTDGKVYYVNRQSRTKNFSGVGSNCLLDIPENAQKIGCGDYVKVYLL